MKKFILLVIVCLSFMSCVLNSADGQVGYAPGTGRPVISDSAKMTPHLDGFNYVKPQFSKDEYKVNINGVDYIFVETSKDEFDLYNPNFGTKEYTMIKNICTSCTSDCFILYK